MLCLPGRGGAVAGVRHAVNRPPEVSLTDRSTGPGRGAFRVPGGAVAGSAIAAHGRHRRAPPPPRPRAAAVAAA
jgi:hypothetical protein